MPLLRLSTGAGGGYTALAGAHWWSKDCSLHIVSKADFLAPSALVRPILPGSHLPYSPQLIRRCQESNRYVTVALLRTIRTNPAHLNVFGDQTVWCFFAQTELQTLRYMRHHYNRVWRVCPRASVGTLAGRRKTAPCPGTCYRGVVRYERQRRAADTTTLLRAHWIHDAIHWKVAVMEACV